MHFTVDLTKICSLPKRGALSSASAADCVPGAGQHINSPQAAEELTEPCPSPWRAESRGIQQRSHGSMGVVGVGVEVEEPKALCMLSPQACLAFP